MTKPKILQRPTNSTYGPNTKRTKLPPPLRVYSPMTAARNLATAAVLLLAMNLRGQEPNPASDSKADATNTVSVNANLVVLSVVIRDKKGALVNNLTKSDFSLKVKDQAQTVRYFDHDTDVPLTLGLLVDVSRSMKDSLDGEKKASESFLETILKPADAAKTKRDPDKAFVIQFAKQIELLQDVTPDRARLEKALAELGTEDPSFHTAEQADTTDSEGRREHHGGTSLYDSLFLATDEVTGKQTGRKALVILTDGVDSGSKEALTDAIEAAQRADTTVYAVYYKSTQHLDQNMGNRGGRSGGGWPGGGGYPGGGGGYPGGGGGYPGGGGGGYPGSGGSNNPNSNPRSPGGSEHKPAVDGKGVLEKICGNTGGRVFEVSKHQTIEEIYAQIAEELHSQYRLGFTPIGIAAHYGYHQIDLSFTKPDLARLQFQTRDGYYGGDSK